LNFRQFLSQLFDRKFRLLLSLTVDAQPPVVPDAVLFQIRRKVFPGQIVVAKSILAKKKAKNG